MPLPSFCVLPMIPSSDIDKMSLLRFSLFVLEDCLSLTRKVSTKSFHSSLSSIFLPPKEIVNEMIYHEISMVPWNSGPSMYKSADNSIENVFLTNQKCAV